MGDNQTSICNGHFVNALFKQDHHHLYDFGHLFFGHALLQLPQIRQILTSAKKKTIIPKKKPRYKCFMTDGETKEFLKDHFLPQNGEYRAVDLSRKDKIGFITTRSLILKTDPTPRNDTTKPEYHKIFGIVYFE